MTILSMHLKTNEFLKQFNHGKKNVKIKEMICPLVSVSDVSRK